MHQGTQPILHSQNQMDESNQAAKISAAKIKQNNKNSSFLCIVPVSLHSSGNGVNTYAFLDSGSTV